MNIVFFPREDYPVEICKHRHGKKMTYVEVTDTIQEESASIILSKAIRRGIRLGAFIRNNNGPLSDYLKDQIRKGDIRFDYYFPGKREGEPSQIYTEAEFDTTYNLAAEWFFKKFDRLPSTLGYGFGYTDYSEFAKKYFLAGRISPFDNSLVDYDNYQRDKWITRSPTFRWYDQAKTIGIENSLDILSGIIDKAYSTQGIVTNFTHWHQMGSYSHTNPLYYTCYDTYFDMLVEKNIENDIHFCSYGEAVEYLVFRQAIKRAVMYRPIHRKNTLAIRLDVELDEFTSKLINIPITLKVNLSGTHLENKEVEIRHGFIYSRKGNEYLIEIPFSNYAGAILF